MKTAKLRMWGEDLEIGFTKETYTNNGNLAIQAWIVEDGQLTEPYCMVTVNLSNNLSKRKDGYAFIDDNNCPREIIEWLEDNGYAICTYYLERSGFCEYYEYIFSNEFLENVVYNYEDESEETEMETTNNTVETNNTNMEDNTMNTMEILTNSVAQYIEKEFCIASQVTKVNKNGIEKFGITMGDGIVRPTLYIDPDDNRRIDEIARQIVETYNNCEKGEAFSDIVNDITDWKNARKKIIPCIMKAKVEGLVQKPYLDMNIYYRIIVGNDANGNSSVTVTEQLLESWDITKETLHKNAMQNVKGTYGAEDMFSVLMGMMPDFKVDEFGSLDNSPMFVVTNESKLYGAAAFVDVELFKAISNDLGQDLYIIPSSIHELIVVPMDKMNEEEIDGMINEVNATCVLPEEQLSDHVYKFINGKFVV